MPRPRATSQFLVAAAVAGAALMFWVLLARAKDPDPWVPMQQRVATWDAVVADQLHLPLPLKSPKPYDVSANGVEATFTLGHDRWTIIGANAAITTPTVRPSTWPVKGEAFEVDVVPEPITNDPILPFSERLPSAARGDTLKIVGAPDSFEAASFVIRSGDQDIRDVRVAVLNELEALATAKGVTARHIIAKQDIDVRVVKCWYQAGVVLYEAKHKTLKPELLLHDDGLVRVDYDHQVVLLRDYDRIEDAPSLVPLTIPRRQNKQFWVTVHITKGTAPGSYNGPVELTVAGKKVRLTLSVDVLPVELPVPAIEYALYYEGVLTEEHGFRPEAHRKSDAQMKADLLDMKAHGLSNATVAHELPRDEGSWSTSWDLLRRTLELRRSVGWGSRPLLYLDWRTRLSDDLVAYGRKIKEIIAIATQMGVHDVFIYGVDERQGGAFAALRPVYEAVHAAGARNFVAIDETTYTSLGRTLIDLPVLWGPGVHTSTMLQLKAQGVRAWKYSKPQAGLEEPATYRQEYGVNLLASGFAGACDYQYQRHSWNDFDDPKGRMNTMAYPTMTAPVPTIEWEGWRKAVDDVRYVTYVVREAPADPKWLNDNCLADPIKCRNAAVSLISRRIPR